MSVYDDQGQLDEALALYSEIFPYNEYEGGKNNGNTYMGMADVYQDQGKLELAIEYYAKALKIDVAA